MWNMFVDPEKVGSAIDQGKNENKKKNSQIDSEGRQQEDGGQERSDDQQKRRNQRDVFIDEKRKAGRIDDRRQKKTGIKMPRLSGQSGAKHGFGPDHFFNTRFDHPG